MVNQTVIITNACECNSQSFTPIQFNPSAWYRSDTGVQAIAGLVSQWNDLSGNGINVNQSNPAKQPGYSTGGVSGRPQITFTGVSNQVLVNLAFTQATTGADVFAVVVPAGIAGNNAYIVDLGIDDNVIGMATATTNPFMYNGTLLPGTNPTGVGVPVIFEGLNLGSGSGSIAVNGGTATAGTIGSQAQAATQLCIGNSGELTVSNSFPGQIYEIIVYPAPLTAAQRAKVIAYLKAEYGIP